jgi:hypothetical protein
MLAAVVSWLKFRISSINTVHKAYYALYLLSYCIVKAKFMLTTLFNALNYSKLRSSNDI